MKLKQTVLILLAGVLIIGGCKKSDKATTMPTTTLPAYDKITRADIAALPVSNFTTNGIACAFKSDAAGPIEHVLKTGDVIVYRTSNLGNYGKLKVGTITATADGVTYKFTADLVTYKPNGDVLASKTDLLIEKPNAYDLDKGELTVVEGDKDFLMGKPNITNSINIHPAGGALFYSLYE